MIPFVTVCFHNTTHVIFWKPIMFKIKQFLVLAFAMCVGVANAADSSPSESASSWLSQAQSEIKAENYSRAIHTLEAANQTNSADWNNLLGYAQRKKSPPDLASAERYYQSALKIDPKHKGALEYYGELLLMKNDLAGAEQMLARLDKACFFSCEEFRDLKEAISKFKSKK
jgi:Tfp pilus assembly protein PilF